MMAISRNGGSQKASRAEMPLIIKPMLSTRTLNRKAPTIIAHHQLRHLISCPAKRGVVYHVDSYSIKETNLMDPNTYTRIIAPLAFYPTCLTAIAVPNMPNAVLLAAGSISSELYVGLHLCDPSPIISPVDFTGSELGTLWDTIIVGDDFVNYVVFVPPGLLNSKSSSIMLLECRNHGVVLLYNVDLRLDLPPDTPRLRQCGTIQLETLPNQVSVSPDGKTLVCVGDTDMAYLYSIVCDDEDNVTFTPLKTYTLLPPSPSLFEAVTVPLFSQFRSRACFTSSWSSDGNRFAVASQEGQITVWDFKTSEVIMDHWVHTPCMAAAYVGGAADGIRSVRFCTPPNGRELLLWIEHNNNLHVLDAETLDMSTHSIISLPSLEDEYFIHNDRLENLAGMCLDPNEEWLYLASSREISEFHVNG